ncbi:MAG: hypothetical protein K6E70_02745 [Butyrivibrio sp.]|nr:hypothetical protein [Butyrivibrio sp.]
MRIKYLLKSLKNDDGYVIMESTFVYPLMFFIIAFLIYSGNMFLLRARIDSEVAQEAINFANHYSNPYTDFLEENGYNIEFKANEPNLTNGLYRYLYTNGEYASKAEKDDLKNRIAQIGLFNNIKPSNVRIVSHDVDNFFALYQTYIVEASYDLKFPIKLIFFNDSWTLSMTAREEIPVTDQAEFIRNIDMAVDYIERTDTGNGIIEQFSRIKNKFDDFIDKFGGKKG